MLTPERMRALGWNFLWLHLHYLMASETGEEHDFFAITCTSEPTLRASAAWRARALAARTRGAGERAPAADQGNASTFGAARIDGRREP
jgi:hypothetical protein